MDFLKTFSDPKSFRFQFLATLLALFLLTKVTCTIGCTVTIFGTLIVLSYTSWKITKFIRKVFFKEKLGSANKAVLVTGCDTGFGHRLAKRLNGQGYTVYAGCLDTNGSGAQDLFKSCPFPKAIKLISLDVTKDSDVEQAYEQITKSLAADKLQLWAIVNNAGVAIGAYVEWGKFSDYQKVFDVNVFGLVRVTRAFLPLIRKSTGRVINVSSMAGRIAVPGMSIYAMSKHAVIAFSQALRREMLPWDVQVCCIEPAGYRTAMTDPTVFARDANKMWNETKESIRKTYGEQCFESLSNFLKENDHTGDPEDVVDAMMDAISDVDPEVVYRVCGSWKYTLAWFLSDYLPYAFADGRWKKKIADLKNN